MDNRYEISDFYRNFFYEVYAHKMGHRCGYIEIPEKHPLYRISYDYIYGIEVHGGWTYADFRDGFFFIGFDCGHLGDGKDFAIMDEKVKMSFETLSSRHEKIHSKEDVEQYCKTAIDQIIENFGEI